MKKNRFRSFALSLAAAIGFISFANTNVPCNNQTVYAVSDKALVNLKYHNKEIVTVDHDQPQFSKSTLSKKKRSMAKIWPIRLFEPSSCC